MGSEFRRNNANLKTVAVLPASRNVPIEGFARKLRTAIEGIGSPTSYLNQVSVSNTLGKHAFTRMGKLKTAAWLADQEQRYKIVLYVADSSVGSSWTKTCIRQADYVLVVGVGDDPSMGEYERLLLSMKTTARKELVLLHPDRSVLPGSTREWLKVREDHFLQPLVDNFYEYRIAHGSIITSMWNYQSVYLSNLVLHITH
jgi:lysophospholipid hydrolase